MNIKKIYSTKELPIFQNLMFNSKTEAVNCRKGDIELVRDLDSGLIFNRSFQPELMEYNPDYQNEQAVSPFFQKHLHDVSTIIRNNFQNHKLIEVGCGKGYFLNELLSQGWDITGIDPAYQGSNPNIVRKYFSADLGVCADAIILRHVLEHIANPISFLSEILFANSGDGKIYIEVPCFDWICKHRAWFDIFYEHVNYFRLSDFPRIFGKIYEAGHCFGGQYLYVVADLASLISPKLEKNDNFIFPSDFLRSFYKYSDENTTSTENKVVWGGASKGVIFSLYMQRAGVNISHIIDINPAKKGKFIPATGHMIESPDEVLKKIAKNSTIFVMNSNYLSEIQKQTSNRFNYITVDNEKF